MLPHLPTTASRGRMHHLEIYINALHLNIATLMVPMSRLFARKNPFSDLFSDTCTQPFVLHFLFNLIGTDDKCLEFNRFKTDT